MKKNKIKQLGIVGFAVLAGALASCAGGFGGGEDSSITTVNILVFQGTGGSDWVKEAGKRFKEANKNVSFEEGKVGVNFKVRSAKGLSWNSEMKASGDDIYIYESNPDIYSLAAQKYLLDLSDVVEPMVDKIDKDVLERLKGSDGKYYALPHYEWFPGLTYDKDLFVEKNYYFADPDAESSDKEVYTCAYGTASFVADSKVAKSVGPNGVKGDYDDGLPSSLEELNILCDKMMQDSVSPIILCGSGHYYSWYLPIALWSSLTGGDGMRNIFCNWTDAEVDVVDGWSNENAFYADSNIATPTTKKAKLSDDNGYLMYSMANRYYALAFCRMAYDNKWIDSKQISNSQGSASEAQNWFVNGHDGTRYGMLWDGSYWCHEAADVGTFRTYETLNPGQKRHTAFMPLPTQLTGQVKEGEGKKPTLINVGNSVTFANKRVATNGKIKAVKEFLKFIYQDSELAAFSEKTGLTSPIQYDYDMSKLDNSYYSDLAVMRKDADVLIESSPSVRQKKNFPFFLIGYTMTLSSFTSSSGKQITGGYLDAFKIQSETETAKHIFEATEISKESWDKLDR
ncbi:MAG TPA: hypothetical protein DEA63_01145 [Firmicutes bacterium]|nr:hypothetical protein [Bacillota bacterium]